MSEPKVASQRAGWAPAYGPLQFAVDECDMPLAYAYRWGVTKRKRPNETQYVIRHAMVNGRQVGFALHREIMLPPPGMLVDHINGNGLDNRRANLRIVTHGQNMANSQRAPGKSGYRGVRRRRGGWQAELARCHRLIIIGLFPTAEEASAAYWEAASEFDRAGGWTAEPWPTSEKPSPALGASGYRGVWPSHHGTKWVARITRNRKRICLGTFDTPEQAHAAWMEAAHD